MTVRRLLFLGSFTLIAAQLLAQEDVGKKSPVQAVAQKGPNILIIMTEGGEQSKYIEKSKYRKNDKNVQAFVTVPVGATVSWKNVDTQPHTAQCLLKVGKGEPVTLFDTGKVDSNDTSAPVLFTPEMYEKVKAASKEGGPVELDYFCLYHMHTTKGKIRLVEKK